MHSSPLKKLTLDNLAFERNNRLLFSGLHCTLQSGELLQIRGANGSGKSSLLRVIAGLIEPQSGSVLADDKPIDTKQVHYVGHQNGIKLYLTVRENLQLQLALATKKSHPDHLEMIIKKMGLLHTQHTPALHLSAGQLRRLALARLLLNPTALWILDEPTTALNAEGQQLLTSLLSQHVADGGIAILALHQQLSIDSMTKTIYLGEQHA